MTYEDRLLTQLKQVVTENAVQPPVRARRLGWKPRLVLGGAAAALVAGGAVIAIETTATPAFAVNARPDGSVSVTINRLEDADQLAKQLAAAGIPTVAKYLPEGKTCADGWFQPVREGRMTSGMQTDGQRTTFTFSKGSLKPGQSLVIAAQYVTVDGPDGKPSKGTGVQLDIAQGPVGTCKIVAAPPFKPAGPADGGAVPGTGSGGGGGGPYATVEPLPAK